MHREQLKYRTYHRLLAYLKPHWKMGLLGVIGTILYSGLDAMFVYLLEPLLNKGFIERNAVFIYWAPYVTVIAFLLRGVTSFLSSYCMTWVARTVVVEFRQKLFHHYLRLPASFYHQSSSGQLLSKLLYDAEQVAQVSMDALTIFVQSLCLIIGLFIVMFTISIPLTCIYLITVPVIAIIVKLTNRRIRKASHDVQKTMGHVTEIAEEAIEGYQVVRLYGGENYEKNKFNQATETSRKQDMKVTLTKGINVSGVQLVASIGIALIIYLAITPEKATLLTAGGFSALLAAMLAMLKPLKNLTVVNSTIQRGLAGAQSIFQLLDVELEKDTGTIPMSRCKGRIKYQAVHFSYDKREILKRINLTIEPGENVALVGRSGSGKTTLVNLLPRFYDVTHGSVELDGIDIRNIHLNDLRKQISIVSQHVVLFNDTIANNIAYGAWSQLDIDAIENAAIKAHAMDFISDLPQGLNTLIGENGVMLSGGQRQRLAIARAIFKNAPLLILDEATSALDTESERHIQAALSEVMRNKTTLVIAHRLSTIEKVDRIVVLDKGEIIEMGTHEQLISKQGFYAKLYAMQFSDASLGESLDVR